VIVQFLRVVGALIVGCAAITSEYVLLALAVLESVIVTFTFANVPETVGVPEIVPVFSPIVRPAGRPVAVQVYGGVPVLVGVKVKLYGRVISPMGNAAVAMPGPGLIVTEYGGTVVAAAPAASRSVTVMLYVPAVVGVPEIVPEAAPIVRPGGRPLALHEYGVVPLAPVTVVAG
jgi:hypothetical protein